MVDSSPVMAPDETPETREMRRLRQCMVKIANAMAGEMSRQQLDEFMPRIEDLLREIPR